MNAYRFLILMPALGVLFAAGLFVYARFSNRHVADPETRTTDPVLQKTQALNPGLRIADEFSRVPVYWIKIAGFKDGILIPKSEAEDAKIRLVDCDAAAIPAQLLYAKRTEFTCLEIDNPSHKLQAYFFRTRDSLKDVVGFYNQLLEPDRRFSASNQVEERNETRRRDDGSREFLFSYYMWQRYDVVAFVGYREERKLA